MDQRLGRGAKDIRKRQAPRIKGRCVPSELFPRTQAPVGVCRDGTMSCNSLNVKD